MDDPTGPATAATARPLPPVSVRALCAFGARRGDLAWRLGPSPSAQDGMLGHRLVLARRGEAYRSEVVVEAVHRGLRVRGRADGYDPAAGRVEEIKTHRGPVARIPDAARALHLAQARCYAFMLCVAEGHAALEVRVVYFDLDRQSETVVAERQTAAELRAAFEGLCDGYVQWAEAEHRHRQARDAWLRSLPWPHDGFREGQRRLAAAVYHAARTETKLLVQAPTGIGKTLATLFPMLKAMPGSGRHAPLDKLVYLTAKNSGRALVQAALQRVGVAAPVADGPARAPLRVVTLLSREQACEHPGRECRAGSCPLAEGFHDRLPAARADAVDVIDDPASLRRVALAHAICPYHLAQELLTWADVIVADYHHLFDPSALLPALAVDPGWRLAALVDEAHNLVPRAREMHSATLTPDGWRALRTALPARLRGAGDRVRRHWRALEQQQRATGECFGCHDAVPQALQQALADFANAVSNWLASLDEDAAGEGPGDRGPSLSGEALEGWFAVLRFLDRAASLDAHGQFEVALDEPGAAASSRGPAARLVVRNVMPAPHLRPRWAALTSAVLFSATLQPPALQRRLLGLPEATGWLDLPSPFDPGRLRVQRVSHVSTRYRDRERSAPALADLIAQQFRVAPGNYLAFVSSFEYLAQLEAQLRARHPDLPLAPQQRGMDPLARQAWVDAYTSHGAQIGLAVLGGVFGEGIDLPGTRLVGVFIATLGLPQLNPVNESVRRRLDQLVGDGHAATYLMPGLQKVVQAAGRVIRTPEDEGLVVLIDDRYARAEVRTLLPPWWRVGRWQGPVSWRRPAGTDTDAPEPARSA